MSSGLCSWLREDRGGKSKKTRVCPGGRVQNHDEIATAREIGLPILILQGERDYQVTMEDLQGWKEGLMKPGQSNLLDNVSIRTYKDLNHLFMSGQGKSTPDEYQVPGHVSEQVITDISGWVKTTGGVQVGGEGGGA